MIYQRTDTSWATKRNCRAFWLFAATNNLLWKQKESWEDWRTLPKDIFPFQHCVSFVGHYLQLNSFGFVLPPIKKYYVNSHKHSSSKRTVMFFCFFSQYSGGPVNSTASCKPALPFSLKRCPAAMSGSQCVEWALTGWVVDRHLSLWLRASSEVGQSWWNYTSLKEYLRSTRRISWDETSLRSRNPA